MESPLFAQHSQDAKLGDWHPAQRPDKHKMLDQADELDMDIRLSPAYGVIHESSHQAVDLKFGPPVAQKPDAAQPFLETGGPGQTSADDRLQSEVNSAAVKNTQAFGNEDVTGIPQRQEPHVGWQDEGAPGLPYHERTLTQDSEATFAKAQTGADGRIPESEGYPPKKTEPDLPQETEFSARSTMTEAFDGDEFENLGNYSRTNSFPDVPPIPNSRLHALPQSQAEDILEENEEDIIAVADDCKSSFPSEASTDGIPKVSFDDLQNERDGDLYTQPATIQGLGVPNSPDEEARYEEGLPLVPSEPQQREALEGLNGGRETANSLEAEWPCEDNFLDGLSTAPRDNYFRPQPLDRKSTSQVLDSMHYAPHNETHDDSSSRKKPSALPASVDGGTSASSGIIVPRERGEHHLTKPITESKDEDLAAMWQAALDDDELLDEEPSIGHPALFEDDGKHFLQDEINESAAQSATTPSRLVPYGADETEQRPWIATNLSDHSGQPGQNRYVSTSFANPQRQPSQGYSTQQLSADLSQTLPPVRNGLSNTNSAPTGFQVLPQQHPPAYRNFSSLRPPMQSSDQSFSDKSKGGYTSPYDLPMNVTRPKKRHYTQQLRPDTSSSAAASRPPPPPRSSSMFTSGSPVVEAHPPLPSFPKSTMSEPSAHAPFVVSKQQSSTGGFFEDLPSIRPRPLTQARRPSPPVQQMTGPTQTSAQAGKPVGPSSSEQTYDLVPPERVSLYDNVPLQRPAGPPMPAVSSRYSPALTSRAHVPPPRTRYAASPSGGPRGPPTQTQPFQPRTSSPLAQNEAKIQQQQQAAAPAGAVSAQDAQQPLSGDLSKQREQHMRGTESSVSPERRSQVNQSFPPMASGRYTQMTNSSTPSYSIYTPESDQLRLSSPSSATLSQEQQRSESLHGFAPPRRSQTQSPGAIKSRPSLPTVSKDTYQRPASANETAVPQQPRQTTVTSIHQPPRRARGFSQSLDYVKPSDGRENDSLERWKGCPIIKFGFGGTIVTTFPKQIPRYASGRSKPFIKCSPSEVKIQSAKTLALDEPITSFPGPLKSKSKKKDILDWLSQRIAQFNDEYMQISHSAALPDRRTRQEEKIILWRIIQVFVEYDGLIEGKASAEKAITLILSSSMAEGPMENLPPSSNNRPSGISRAIGASTLSDPTNPEDLEALRRLLLQGERERAVWHALDRRMWAHAMLISSTMDKSVWKQVLQEFIRQEVRAFGENTESLAALYQIFAGNWEESVDELVPPSARAGLQFVSKAAGPGRTRNALDGLERWRETLTLALSNRSQDDGKALVALGRLLSGYGRVEAAHTCFILARAPGVFGGADDPSVNVALLGVDHLQYPCDFSRDFDSILLTEIYDFACTVLASSTSVTVSPHLQPYRLYHALILAEYGYRFEAQQYCEVITNALKSTTKRPLYYHDLLFGTLDELVSRLHQAPTDSSSSWMSKPSLDKVSGSFFSRVNQFIAGDDSDADSAASGKGLNPVTGPFAGVSRDTPNISRSSSSTDLYGSYSNTPPLRGELVASRYAPNGQYAPRSSLENKGGLPQEYRRPSEPDSVKPMSSAYQCSPTLSRPASSGNQYHQPPQLQAAPQQGYPPRNEGHLPAPPSHSSYMSEALPKEISTSLYEQEPYRPAPPPDIEPSQDLGQHQPIAPGTSLASPPPSHQPPASTYAPSNSSYLPLGQIDELSAPQVAASYSAYEPPSYSAYSNPTYAPNTDTSQSNDESPVKEKLKGKSFMDDNDADFEARAAAVLKQEKAQKDRDVDEAFRKVAEADGEYPFPMNLLSAC